MSKIKFFHGVILAACLFMASITLQNCREKITDAQVLDDKVLESVEKDLSVARRGVKPRPKGSIATILVDFDGHYVSGTLWNTNGPIDATPSGYGNHEKNLIVARVKAMAAVFNDSLVITTDETTYNRAPFNKRTRVIVTAYYQWYSNQYGGVAYINSFTWGDDTPCFVFNILYNNDIDYVSHAVLHEACHTIGLRHHADYTSNIPETCVKITDYHPGCVIGRYNGGLSVFDIGPNSLGCTVIVDEAEFIKSKL